MENQALQPVELAALVYEARNLAKALGSPGKAHQAKATQERLQTLQKSSAGWDIANGFLGSDDPNVRFFGPLTLTIKIHQEWDQLGEERIRELWMLLVDRFVVLVDAHEKPVVLNKFVTTLTTFFFKDRSPWVHCIRHLAVSMANGKFVAEEEATKATFEQLALPLLCYERVMAVLAFSTTLAHESIRYARIKNAPTPRLDALQANLEDAFVMINFAFERALNGWAGTADNLPERSCQTLSLAIKSAQDWIHAIRSKRVEVEPAKLRALVSPAFDYTVRFLMNTSVGPAAMEFLSDVLQWHSDSKILEARHLDGILDFLASPLAEQYTQAFLSGEEDDEAPTRQYYELLTRYVIVEAYDMLTCTLDDRRGQVLDRLYKLLYVPGVPGVEDRSFTDLMVFWTEAADTVYNLVLEEVLPATNEIIQRNFMQALFQCVDRVRYPDHEQTKDWDDDDVNSFNACRREFSEFVLSSYPLLGVELVRGFQQAAYTALGAQNWATFEVSMFCIDALNEAIAENEAAGDILRVLFHSESFIEVWVGRQPLPVQAQKTLAQFLTDYGAYFKRDHALIPPVLTFLFSSFGILNSAHTISKAILSICDTCREFLFPHAEGFVDKFNDLRSNTPATSHPLERVAEGVAAVIQAEPSEAVKASFLLRLLRPLYEHALVSRQQKAAGNGEPALELALTSIRLTASIGRGIRSPVMDVEKDEAGTQQDFWFNDPLGQEVRTLIIGILDVVVTEFLSDGEIIDAACDVLKAGYTERSGPYVLPPGVTVHFVKAVAVNSPRFSTVMATASAFLSSYNGRPSEVHAEVLDLSLHFAQLLFHMGTDRGSEQFDPEVAHGCVDFLKRLLPAYKAAFFRLTDPIPNGPPPLDTTLNFATEMIKGPDPLPLRASCEFWRGLLELSEQDQQFAPLVGNYVRPGILDPYLARLGEVLMQQVGGGGARSDIVHLSGVIKTFVFHHQGAARAHFQNALASLPLGSQQGQLVSGQDRQRFLMSLLAMRANVDIKPLLRDFWLLCRGDGFAYTR